jgi:hypothetical protein
MDFLWKNLDACWSLLLGGMLLLQAVADCKSMTRIGLSATIMASSGLMAAGLLRLLDLIPLVWMLVFDYALWGVWSILDGSGRLYVGPVPGRPSRVFVGAGVALILLAAFMAANWIYRAVT